MSRILRQAVNRAFLTKSCPLNILMISGNREADEEIISESTRHKFYILGENRFFNRNAFACNGKSIISNLSYSFDCVLTTGPYKHFNNARQTAEGIHIPAIFVHAEVPAHVKKELLFGAAHSMEIFTNVTADKKITDELHLYDAIEKTGTWGEFLNELLYNQ